METQTTSLAADVTPRSGRAQSLAAVKHLNDHAGHLHVLAQDAVGDCWYFDDSNDELWLKAALQQPSGCTPGTAQIAETADGKICCFAIGAKGTVWRRCQVGNHWEQWQDIGHSNATHLATCRTRRALLLAARDQRGTLSVCVLDFSMKKNPVWVRIADQCAGQPAILLAGDGHIVILYRGSRGELFEVEEMDSTFGHPKQISAPPITSDPQALLTANGKVVAIVLTQSGLVVKQRGNTWLDVDAFRTALVLSNPRLTVIDTEILLVTGVDKTGSLITKTNFTDWINTKVAVDPLSILSRLYSGRWDYVVPSWLSAVIHSVVSGFQIHIDEIHPDSPLFEGDELTVVATITNKSPAAATGSFTATIRGAYPNYYSHQLDLTSGDILGLPSGSSTQCTFKTGNYQHLTAGTATISLNYVSYSTPPIIIKIPIGGPDAGREQAIGGIVDFTASTSRIEKIWSFEEPFPTDAPEVIPGPAVCQVMSPDLDAPIQSYNYLSQCRTVQLPIYEPATINDAAEIVRKAVFANQRVRVIGHEHSANAQICTDGVAIKTGRLCGAAPSHSGKTLLWQPAIDYDADLSWNTGSDGPANPPRVVIHEGQETVQVGPGLQISDLNDWLDGQGYSLGYAVPGFRLPTVGGAISTGTHGSSVTHSVVLSSRVKWLLVIRADGAIVEYSATTTDSDTWRALCCGLGFLGVTVQIRLAIEPAFNLKVKVDWISASDLLAPASPIDLVKGSDWCQMVWFPYGGSSDGPVARFMGYKTDEAPDLSVNNRILAPTIPVAVKLH